MGKKGDNKKGKAPKITRDDDGEVPDDERFSAVLSAPVFKNLSKEKHKVEIDDRFKSMLTDDRFKVLPGGSVDAYGRKKKSKRGKSELEELYQVGADDEIDNEEMEEKTTSKSGVGNESKSAGKGGKAEMEKRLDYLTKLARGEISDDNESDEDSDEEEGDDMDEDDDEVIEVSPEEWEAMQLLNGKSPLDVPEEEDVETGEATKRISILNCDWENIKANDLMMILQSFCPSGKQVHKVTVYPSDFGKQKMAEEAKYGPRGIWKAQEEGDEMSEMDDYDEDDETEDENGSLYDQIEANELSDEENDDEDVEEDEEDEVGESDEDDESSEKGKKKKSAKSKKDYGEFKRKQGAVGLILHDELVERNQKKHSKSHQDSDDEDSEEAEDNDDEGTDAGSHSQHGGSKKSNKSNSDFNAVALRQYELGKLRYYFAIADCDSVETANALYEALDGVEFEHSAMALEIRFVPDDLDLTDREVRDECSNVPDARRYKPPEFVVNAKQHTNVTCTWDEGEKDREKTLTNFSAWRNLKESDFAQYLASESEDDEEEEDEEEDEEDRNGDASDNHSADGVGTKSVKSTADKKKERARSLRKMLLGDDGSSDDDSEHDDFFNESLGGSDNEESEVQEKAKNKKSKPSKEIDDLGENDELVMTYVPEAEKDQIMQRKREREGLTPYEIEMQKSTDKKKARKAARKAEIEEKLRQEKDEELMRQAQLKKEKKHKKKSAPAADGELMDEEEAELHAEDMVESYRGRAQQQTQDLQKQRKKKINKKTPLTAIEDDLDRKHQQNAHRAIVTDANFKVDTKDARFAKVFEGDAKFGIDRTASEFRATPGMKKILAEQRKRRHEEEESRGNKAPDEDQMSAKRAKKSLQEEDPFSGKNNVDVNQLANKLKNKFQPRK